MRPMLEISSGVSEEAPLAVMKELRVALMDVRTWWVPQRGVSDAQTNDK